MKAQVILSALIMTLIIGQYSQLNAQTNVSGNITTNTTWTVSGSPYVLTGDIRVRGGATLTVESGVQVNLGNRYFYVGYYDYWGSSESGMLQATGVTFTGSGGNLQFEYNATGTISNCSFINTNVRFKNSSGPSVTNNNFDLNSPIYLHSQEVIPKMSGNTFGSGKFYISLSFTKNTTIKNYTNCTYYLDGEIRVRGGATLTIESGVQVNLGNRYFYVGYYDYWGSSESGILQATGVTFTGSGGILQFEYNASGQIMNCDFSYQVKIKGIDQSNVIINRSNFGVFCSVENTSSIVMNAKNNYWGDVSGPKHPTLNPSGQGATVSDKVDFIPFSTSPFPITDVEELNSNIPVDFALYQNYPNPFNPSTTIEFGLPQTSFVTFEIYNLLGEKVATLVSQELHAGTYRIQWDASGVTSGVYMYRLQAGSFAQTKKLILLR